MGPVSSKRRVEKVRGSVNLSPSWLLLPECTAETTHNLQGTLEGPRREWECESIKNQGFTLAGTFAVGNRHSALTLSVFSFPFLALTLFLFLDIFKRLCNFVSHTCFPVGFSVAFHLKHWKCLPKVCLKMIQVLWMIFILLCNTLYPRCFGARQLLDLFLWLSDVTQMEKLYYCTETSWYILLKAKKKCVQWPNCDMFKEMHSHVAIWKIFFYDAFHIQIKIYIKLLATPNK